MDRSGMQDEQAQALSRIFAEMASKTDIAALRAKVSVLEARLTWRIVGAIVFSSTLMTLVDLFVD